MNSPRHRHRESSQSCAVTYRLDSVLRRSHCRPQRYPSAHAHIGIFIFWTGAPRRPSAQIFSCYSSLNLPRPVDFTSLLYPSTSRLYPSRLSLHFHLSFLNSNRILFIVRYLCPVRSPAIFGYHYRPRVGLPRPPLVVLQPHVSSDRP